jgi:hypothetical protein
LPTVRIIKRDERAFSLTDDLGYADLFAQLQAILAARISRRTLSLLTLPSGSQRSTHSSFPKSALMT